jgi:hypothetical protein
VGTLTTGALVLHFHCPLEQVLPTTTTQLRGELQHAVFLPPRAKTSGDAAAASAIERTEMVVDSCIVIEELGFLGNI